MAGMLDYPMGAIRAVARSVFGWGLVIVLTSMFGAWAGSSIASRSIAGPFDSLMVWCGAVFIAYAFLPAFVCMMTTAMAWIVPLQFESRWLYIVAAAVDLLVWAVMTVLVVRGWF
jgi:hypothetical protein